VILLLEAERTVLDLTQQEELTIEVAIEIIQEEIIRQEEVLLKELTLRQEDLLQEEATLRQAEALAEVTLRQEAVLLQEETSKIKQI